MKNLIILALPLLISAFAFAEETVRYETTRAEIEAEMKNFDRLLAKRRRVPQMRDGKFVGFKLERKPGSVNSSYDRLRLRESETISTVNQVNRGAN